MSYYTKKKFSEVRNGSPTFRDYNIKYITLGFGNSSAKTILNDFLLQKDFSLLNAYHPKSIISNNTEIGRETVILAGAYVGPYCKMGNYGIINCASTVSHNSFEGKSIHIYHGVHKRGIANIVQKELEC